jgi:hypothetical protein
VNLFRRIEILFPVLAVGFSVFGAFGERAFRRRRRENGHESSIWISFVVALCAGLLAAVVLWVPGYKAQMGTPTSPPIAVQTSMPTQVSIPPLQRPLRFEDFCGPNSLRFTNVSDRISRSRLAEAALKIGAQELGCPSDAVVFSGRNVTIPFSSGGVIVAGTDWAAVVLPPEYALIRNTLPLDPKSTFADISFIRSRLSRVGGIVQVFQFNDGTCSAVLRSSNENGVSVRRQEICEKY